MEVNMRRRLALIGALVVAVLSIPTAGANATTNTANDATLSRSPIAALGNIWACC